MTVKEKKELMYKRIEKHGNDLCKLFNLSCEPIALCKKLFKLENKLHSSIENSYLYVENGINEKELAKIEANILKKLGNILFKDKIPDIPIFTNYDVRGYTLKIDDEYIRENNVNIYTDWGGYGIIVPDFNVN